MATPPRLDSVFSFGDAAATENEARRPPAEADPRAFFSDAGSDDDEDEDFGFEFAFAPPLHAPGGALDLAPADDLFSHGRIVPAYPVFDRHLLDDVAAPPASSSSSPASPDTYCDWAPRSAPGSPSRSFPKSASAGEARRHHHWRLRDFVALGGGRSRSDGKEKFVFLQPAADKQAARPATKPPTPSAEAPQKQSKKKGGKVKAAAATTEMDMATVHRLFYGGGKQQKGAGGDRRRQQQQQQSYLPYRPAIGGFFATAHALGRARHPY
ncbi:hypothetical protein U9M48_025759 [Paspalum notatum var. saurae]|uniref:Uncharacterized protein n=1 Tax=Paspalum notatum var. saurae TaxID=547442 RepID=A0AAQ3TVM9_PASNO